MSFWAYWTEWMATSPALDISRAGGAEEHLATRRTNAPPGQGSLTAKRSLKRVSRVRSAFAPWPLGRNTRACGGSPNRAALNHPGDDAGHCGFLGGQTSPDG